MQVYNIPRFFEIQWTTEEVPEMGNRNMTTFAVSELRMDPL